MDNAINRMPLWPVLGLSLVYICGAIGMCIPEYADWFRQFVPINLLLSFVLLLAYHKDRSIGFYVAGVFVVLSGFFVEVIGVHTGRIFGAYSYTDWLGPKLFEVPLILGANWFLLIYMCAALMQRSHSPAVVQIFGGALLMVGMDTLVEPVAIAQSFWIWPAGQVPSQNFLGWFVVSSVLLAVLYPLRIRYDSGMVYPMFILQILFFLIQNIYFLWMR